MFCFVLFGFFFRETQLKSRGRLKNSLHLLNQKIVLVFIYIMILHKSLVLWCVQVKNPCKFKKKIQVLDDCLTLSLAVGVTIP